ncbi:MAG: transcriptional regulator [Thermodesulfobacteriota bacterium]|nr:MAG: transcriptional regulator [Thermodesulfobacteriota bacterium]
MNRKVKALMVLNNIKGVDIAKKLGVSPTTVYVVLSGKGKSRRIQKAVAEALDMTVEDLWPNGNNKAA